MKILFVHQNFPGQFLHLAPALAARGHEVLALTSETNQRRTNIRVMKYRAPAVSTARKLGTTYMDACDRGWKAARAARQMRDQMGYVPDVIVGHPGWGETLFLREVWPEARMIAYAELMYRTEGFDVGFDPEFTRADLEARVSTTARSAHLIQAMLAADASITPTAFQAASFQPAFRATMTQCHDGIDTARLRPDPEAVFQVPGGPSLRAGDEVLTYVGRSLEPYRGIHTFLRALPGVLASRPNAQVVIVGEEGQSYGAPPPEGTWKERFLSEIRDRTDMSRIHFTGRLTYADYVSLLQVSRVHAYLTYPFVLSWSMLEAMAVGALVVGSDTGPVREVIRDGQNGYLVDFFDAARWSTVLADALADPARDDALRRAGRNSIIAEYDLHGVCLPKLTRLIEGDQIAGL